MNIDPLIRWATAREAARRNKLKGAPPPWTDDPIIRQFRFCNVRRSDDRVSQWLIANVFRAEFIQESLTNFLLFTAFCRWVNWPPTIKYIADKGLWPASQLDWTVIGSAVDEYHRQGNKAWTGAYMVRAKPGDNRGKGCFVAEDVIERSLGPRLSIIKTELTLPVRKRENVWSVLADTPNWGSFMSGQVVADWGYTELLTNAVDTKTWAPIGPGSKRGFNRLMERPLAQRVDPEEWSDRLQEWRRALIGVLGVDYSDLTLHDVQNCLCETDKYLRVKTGQGRPRALYSSHEGLY